jgi:hypothetical protein
MQAIAVSCDYDDKTPFTVDAANKVWSLVMANSEPSDSVCLLGFEGHGARFEALSKSHAEQRSVTYIYGDRHLYRRRHNGRWPPNRRIAERPACGPVVRAIVQIAPDRYARHGRAD